jgi:peptide/nickel transport system substrate-binding protein
MTPAKRRGVTLLASLTLATTALGGTVTAQSEGGEPTTGGTLVIGEWQGASQLNPFFTNAFADTEAYTPAYRALVTINNDGLWVPDLAVEVPTVENGGIVPGATPADGFTINVKLKPGLLWSDGQPLTLNDFKFNYEYALQIAEAGVGCTACSNTAPLIDPALTGDALYAPENQFIESITVADDGLSASIKFRQNYAGWLGVIGVAFLPQHFFKDMTPADAGTVMAVGSETLPTVPTSGPFTITAASTDGIDYARNDNWKASDPAWLDALRFRFFGSKDGMITAFLNNEIDVALNMTQGDYPAIAGVDPNIGRADLDSAWQYEHLDMNVTRPGLNDPEVRKAVAMAIDKQDLIKVLFPGLELEPACSQAPPGTWWRIEVECPPYDPEGAMAVLDAAGWVVNEDTGLREKTIDGVVVPLRFHMCTSAGNPTRLTDLGKINQYLNAIGIPSDIQTADASSVFFASWADTTDETQCSIYRGTYDIALFAYILGGDLYSNYFFPYHSTQIPPVSNNTTRISVPALDAALDKLGTEIDPEAQKAAAATMQTELASALPEIPLYYRAEATGVSNHVGGYERYNPSSAGPTWDVEKWFFVP